MVKTDEKVNKNRVQKLKDGKIGDGPVVYWMSRDQRMDDNWALLYAAENAAKRGVPLAVVFNLVPSFLGAGARQFGFMLRGLRQLADRLQSKNIHFAITQGDPGESVPAFVSGSGAGLLVTDMSPLRIGKKWREEVQDAVDVPMHMVDAHNVVPVWVASDKKEVGARTLRARLHRNFPEYMVEFPEVPELKAWGDTPSPAPEVEWDALIARVVEAGAAVPEVAWCVPGEAAGRAVLADFVGRRIKLYESRNDPSKPQALSGLSPYLHFGQVGAQRAALEAQRHAKAAGPKAVEGFIEELVVRRELSDNFCWFTEDYDKLHGQKYAWATDTLQAHAGDRRPYTYSLEQLEAGKTHDDLWNAGQLEMVHGGKMHGFTRMYWAKKILEWTASPEQALEWAIFLNDKYQLDGRDPNGYVGCMWSIVGVHDQGWAERPIFGKIRYMAYDSTKKKFSIPGYVARVKALVAAVKGDQGSKAAANPGGWSHPALGASGEADVAMAAAEKKAAPKKKEAPPLDRATLLELVAAAVKAAEACAAQESEADASRAVDALSAIARHKVTMDLLVDTQCGKQVRKICKHSNSRVAATAKDLVGSWQKIVMKASAKSGA